jgi:hypothetical protein
MKRIHCITQASNLYQVVLNNPGLSRYLTNFAIPGMETPLMISLVSDKNAVINQMCFADNGSVGLAISGLDGP